LALGVFDYELVAHDATGYGLPGTSVSATLALAAPTPMLAASTAAGTLVAGTYTYGLIAHTATGYSLIGTTTSITTTATGEVVISWGLLPDVTSVDVYGRVSGSLGLLASGITAQTWTDDGSVTVGAAAPTTATATGEIVLTWVNPVNETAMDVYGRISGSVGLLASGVTGTTWTDTGAATVGAAPPTTATSNAVQSVTQLAAIYPSLVQHSPFLFVSGAYSSLGFSTTTSTIGGTIPASTTTYYLVLPVVYAGIIFPWNAKTTVTTGSTTPTNSNTTTFNYYSGANSYNIYSTTTNPGADLYTAKFGLIGTVKYTGNASMSFIDTGITPGAPLPGLIGGSFTVIPFNFISFDNYNGWDTATNSYTIPKSGIWQIISNVRYQDSTPAGQSCSINADINVGDSPTNHWFVTNGQREGAINARIAYYNQGSVIKAFSFNSGGGSVFADSLQLLWLGA
jgi:hypothetical protein